MELILIRHGLPIRREVLDGPADPELSLDGKAQAQFLAEYLSSEQVHAIYASPLRRAYQTAEPLATLASLPIVVVDDIAEYDRHSNEYVPVEELKAANDPRWLEMVNNGWTNPDESQAEFGFRVCESIEAIIDRHPSQTVAVVCHGGVINAYLAKILAVPESRGFFYPNYTSIHRVQAARSGQRQIVTINETAHLRGTGLVMGLHNQ